MGGLALGDSDEGIPMMQWEIGRDSGNRQIHHNSLGDPSLVRDTAR